MGRNEKLAKKRKDQIAKAAIKVFSKKGFEGSTTKEIAKCAKVSEGTIFRYFKTKKDILLYMIDLLTEQNLQNYQKEIQQGQDAKTALKQMLKLHYRLIVAHSDIFKVILYEMQFHKDLQQKFYKDIVQHILKDITQILTKLDPDKKIDPDIRAQAILGIFFGLMISRNTITKASPEDETKVIQEILKLLLYGINKKT